MHLLSLFIAIYLGSLLVSFLFAAHMMVCRRVLAEEQRKIAALECLNEANADFLIWMLHLCE